MLFIPVPEVRWELKEIDGFYVILYEGEAISEKIPIYYQSIPTMKKAFEKLSQKQYDYEYVKNLCEHDDDVLATTYVLAQALDLKYKIKFPSGDLFGQYVKSRKQL